MGKGASIFKYFLSIISFCLSCQVYSQEKSTGNKDSLIAEIDFQKGFKNDTLSFKINNVEIINKQVVTSHSIIDFTGISLKVFSDVYSSAYIKNGKDTIYGVKMETDKLFIQILINQNKLYSFNLKISDGKYIGIFLERDKIPKIMQSKRMYMYD